MTRIRKQAVMLAGWSYRAMNAELEDSASLPEGMISDAVVRALT